MQPFLLPITSKLTVLSVIDILVVAVLIYQFIMAVRGRRAAPILTGIGVLLVVYLGATYRLCLGKVCRQVWESL